MVLFGLVYVHVMAAQNQLRLDQLNRHAASQQALYQRLRLQVAQLESPQHIVSTAVGRLGMQQPSSITYLAPSGPAASALVAPGAGAGPVAGDADWPQIKSQLAGSP